MDFTLNRVRDHKPSTFTIQDVLNLLGDTVNDEIKINGTAYVLSSFQALLMDFPDISHLKRLLNEKPDKTEVFLIQNNLKELKNKANARLNLEVYSKKEVDLMTSPRGVKQAYESNPNTNAFTDYYKKKLGLLNIKKALDLDALVSEVRKHSQALQSGLPKVSERLQKFSHLSIKAGTSHTLETKSPPLSGQLVLFFLNGLLQEIPYSISSKGIRIIPQQTITPKDNITVRYYTKQNE